MTDVEVNPLADPNLPMPDWLQAGSYSANQDRYLIEAVWPTSGVLTGMVVAPRGAGANMSVDVGPGAAVAHGTDIANQGSYLCRLLATSNVAPIGAAPGVGLSRIDLIVAQVTDPVATGTGTAGWTLAVVPGTQASSPSPPATPPSAVVLAQISVPNGTAQITAAQITDARTMLAQPGAVPPKTGRLASTTGTGSSPPVGSSVTPTMGPLTVTVAAGRRLKLTMAFQFSKDATAGNARSYLYEGATQLAMALTAMTANGWQWVTLTMLIDNPSPGTHTYTPNISCDVGAVTLFGTVTTPWYFLVEDIGAYP